MRERNHFIGLWLNDEELSPLREQCKITGLSASVLIRHALVGVQLWEKLLLLSVWRMQKNRRSAMSERSSPLRRCRASSPQAIARGEPSGCVRHLAARIAFPAHGEGGIRRLPQGG